jgi:hypothetical protein
MYPDPHLHQLIAADRAESLRAAYAHRPREPRLRRLLGLRLVALGRRLAEPSPRRRSAAPLRSSRA